jgi:hypothetical protein
MRLRFQPAGLFLVALLLLLAVPARAQERIEGTVASAKLTRCEMKPGTCEGSLVLETRDAGKLAQVTINVPKGTAIKKGTDHLFLPALKGQPVAISFVTEKGERVAKSIEVKSAGP